MSMIAEKISKRYFRKTGGANYFLAVQPLDLEVREGRVTVLTGRSGSGKTTLLNMLCGLLSPTEGRVLLDGTDLYLLGDKALSRLRSEKIGVVPRNEIETVCHDFKSWIDEHNLLPSIEHRKYPMMIYHAQITRIIAKRSYSKIRHRAANWVKQNFGDFRKW